jgi:hypothetical protein
LHIAGQFSDKSSPEKMHRYHKNVSKPIVLFLTHAFIQKIFCPFLTFFSFIIDYRTPGFSAENISLGRTVAVHLNSKVKKKKKNRTYFPDFQRDKW